MDLIIPSTIASVVSLICCWFWFTVRLEMKIDGVSRRVSSLERKAGPQDGALAWVQTIAAVASNPEVMKIVGGVVNHFKPKGAEAELP